jgi:hypothetical protein
MGMPKVRKKPTNKEMASAIIEINSKTERNAQYINQLDSVTGLLIEHLGIKDEFNKFVEKRFKELREKNDQKEDGKSDKQDIPTDTGDKGAGAEGVREETK